MIICTFTVLEQNQALQMVNEFCKRLFNASANMEF